MNVTLSIYLEYWTLQSYDISYLDPFVLDVTLISGPLSYLCYTHTVTPSCKMLHSHLDLIVLNVTLIPGPHHNKCYIHTWTPLYILPSLWLQYTYINGLIRDVDRKCTSSLVLFPFFKSSNATTIDQYRLRLFVCTMIIGTEKRYLDHTKVLANSVKKTHLVTKIFGNYQISEWNVWLQEMTLKDIFLLFPK